MHIVDVAEFYAPMGGGVRTYIDAKLALADQHGVRVSIIAPGPEYRVEERRSGQIIWLPSPAVPFDKNYHLFWKSAPVHRLLDELRPDVVEASSPLRAASIVAKWKGSVADRAHKSLVLQTDPVAAHPQIWFQNFLPAQLVDRACFWFWGHLRRTSRAFSSVIVGSDWFSRRLAENGRIASTMIPLGVDTELFHSTKRNREYRRQLLAGFGLSPSATLLVGVGRHHPEKQWPLVFEAVGALASRNIAMIQIGNGYASGRVRQAAAKAGNVRLLGHMEDRARLADTMASADAMVHGSRAETFALAAAEGLASGLPLILPSEGGCTDLADPAWSEVYKVGSSASACQAIERLLARNPQELRAAALRARDTHITTAASHFEQLFALYGKAGRPEAGLTSVSHPVSSPLPAIA